MVKRKDVTVKDNGTGLVLVSGTWRHPLSYEEGEELKGKLERLLRLPGYDSFEVSLLLPEDGGTERIIIDRKNAFMLFVELKRLFNV